MKTYHAQLYLEKLSRDKTGFKTNPNAKWSDFKSLESAFLNKYPDLKNDYDLYMKKESSNWRQLFSENFKRHSLSVFVEKNVEVENFYY